MLHKLENGEDVNLAHVLRVMAERV